MLSISPWHVEYFRQTLLSEGFEDVFLQIWKRGQVFGYSRRLAPNVEWHVRAFGDGTLESELEQPRTTIQHLLRPTYFSDGLLAQLLQRHWIPFSYRVNSFPYHMALWRNYEGS